MNNKIRPFAVGVIILAVFHSGSVAENASANRTAAAASGAGLPAIDKSIEPCADFYQYACGAWMKDNPVPPDQSRWGRFAELAERNRTMLRDILEAAAAPKPGRAVDSLKIGDFYASCMDEKSIDAKGIGPMKDEMDKIQKLGSRRALVDEIARLHSTGVNAIFDFGSSQDYQDASQMIAAADQSGLSLPDRDYYLLDKFSVERRNFEEHVANMFVLLGSSPAGAALQAKTVLKIETALAKDSMDRVARRNPKNIHHKMKLAELASMTPSFNWNRYLEDVRSPAFLNLDVANPEFFKQMQERIEEFPLIDWKTYLRWHLIHANAAVLPTTFVNEDFDFFGKSLRGQKEIKPRWKRCVMMTDGAIGEALGREYVEKQFGPEAKAKTLVMVQQIEKAMQADIDQLPWMGPETKKKALEKLRAITNKIGYPEKWRDYSKLVIVRGDALGNRRRAVDFEFHRQVDKIGHPVDKSEWFMTPPTVNAYYDPQMNNINFPAGILQPPFFNASADDAVNYGAIGAVIGHELTHAFDDEGSQYDAEGNLKNWWTEQDEKAFEQRTQALAEQYSQYVAVKTSTGPASEIKVNGKLTLGENTADNGGIKLSYVAYEENHPKAPELAGFSPEQRFFFGFAQVWCNNQTDQTAKMLATTDPHSPPKYRVEGTLANMPQFRQAFSCGAGAGKANGVW